MTVCIAALYENNKGFVLASDQMTTAHIPIGYEFENEEVKKIVRMKEDTNIFTLIAGDVLFANEVIEAVKADIDTRGITATSIVAEAIRAHYQNVRRQHIVRNELEARGLTIDTYYQNHKQLFPQVVQLIDNAFRNWSPKVDMIMAGQEESHCNIFSITNPGDLYCHDSIGFVAVGSGAPHAMYSLIESGYKKSMDAEKVYKLVERAKRRSEVAPGVGRGTGILKV